MYLQQDIGKPYDTLSAREPKRFERWWVNGRPTPVEFDIGDATGRGENRLVAKLG
jgi:hypothetical protein